MKKDFLLYYALWFSALRIGIPAVFYAISKVFGSDMSVLVPLLPAMYAATYTGKKIARDQHETISFGKAQLFAVQATLIAVVIECTVSVLLAFVPGLPQTFRPLAAALTQGYTDWEIGRMGVILLVGYCCNWLLFMHGARGELQSKRKDGHAG